MRRGLRIRFNWDYISIKTSFPLEREKAASNFEMGEEREGERDRRRREEEGRGDEKREETNN